MEIWKPIPANPNYEASSAGRIRSLGRKLRFVSKRGTESWRVSKTKVLATDKKINNAGYRGVSLGGKISRFVHQCVWEAFNGPIPQGQTINHINGNKLDNRLSNLEMCSCKENNRKAWDMGLFERVRKNQSKRWLSRGNPKNVLSKEQAREIVERNLAGERQKDLAKEFGITQPAVSYARRTKWYE